MKVSKEIVSNDKKDEPLIFISDRVISLYNDNKILKARIDKAIEYLKENACYTDNNEFVCDLRYDNCEELLDILKGSDTNAKD